MRKSRSNMHIVEQGIEWTEAHCPCMVFDGQVELASIGPYPATQVPRRRQVRIQGQCPVYECSAIIKVADKPGQRMSSPGQGDGIILAQLHSPPGQACALGTLLRAVDHPSVQLAPDVTPCGHAMGRGKFRIELDSLAKQTQRFVVRNSRPLVDVCHSAQEIVVSIKALGRFALCALDLGLLQLWSYFTHDACRHLVLQIENVLKSAVKALCPQMRTRGSVDELCGYTNAIGGFAHTAFEDIAHAQVAAYLFD